MATNIATNLKQLKKVNKMSTRKLSEASGVKFDSIKSILSGQSQNPRIHTLSALAGALGCTVDILTTSAPEDLSASREDLEDKLFRNAIDITEKIAKELDVEVAGNNDLKAKCAYKIYEYAIEKSNSPEIDEVYAKWCVKKYFLG